MLVPVMGTVLLSFTSYDIVSPPKFVWFDNFKHLLSEERLRFIYANTLKLAFILVVAHMIVGLLLALGVDQQINRFKKTFYRMFLFFPAIVTTSSVAIAWHYMYSTDFGVINFLLGKIGIGKIPWLTSSAWTAPTIVIFSLWKFVGNSFIYYLIGLQSIDRMYYEAAQVEGASSWQIFFRVTLPLLSPTVFFVMVNLMIGATQMFDEPFLITGGGPGDASRTVNLFLYETAYHSFNFGYASTVAVSLFMLILFMTLVQFKVSNSWVNYENE
jgi:multiple sugar transport system permease protein